MKHFDKRGQPIEQGDLVKYQDKVYEARAAGEHMYLFNYPYNREDPGIINIDMIQCKFFEIVKKAADRG